MISKATRRMLLELRRLGEASAQAALAETLTRVARAEAQVARERARVETLAARRARAEGKTGATARAGLLADRVEFLRVARADERAARLRLREALLGRGAAERALDRARAQVGASLRAREAAQAYETAQELTEARARNRRDDAASQDRWRGPPAATRLTPPKRRR